MEAIELANEPGASSWKRGIRKITAVPQVRANISVPAPVPFEASIPNGDKIVLIR